MKNATFSIITLTGSTKDKILADMGRTDAVEGSIMVPCWVVEVTESHVAAKLGSEPPVDAPIVLIPNENIISLFGA